MPQLLNRLTGEYEDAQIINPLEQSDIDCFISEWHPILKAKVDALKASGKFTLEELRAANVLDAHWEWPQKFVKRRAQLEWNSFAVRCAGRTQGLMFVNLVQRARLNKQLNQHLVYVDILSTAPWNRPRLTDKPLYRGAGDILMTEALLLSRDEGFGGRLGLHSLPGAQDFYRDQWQMECLGPDSGYSGLEYFEMTTEGAAKLLSP